jgi:hypothetical protein
MSALAEEVIEIAAAATAEARISDVRFMLGFYSVTLS